MLVGTFEHALDPKNRIFVPASFRSELGQVVVVTKNIRSKSLRFSSMDEWEKYIAPIKAAPRRVSERTLRFLYSGAVTPTPDSQGRILLSSELIKYAGIEKTAYIIGLGSYGEIWSEANYLEAFGDDTPDDFIDELEEIGL